MVRFARRSTVMLVLALLPSLAFAQAVLTGTLRDAYGAVMPAAYSYTQPNGGTWNEPTTILAPRFARFDVTLNY